MSTLICFRLSDEQTGVVFFSDRKFLNPVSITAPCFGCEGQGHQATPVNTSKKPLHQRTNELSDSLNKDPILHRNSNARSRCPARLY